MSWSDSFLEEPPRAEGAPSAGVWGARRRLLAQVLQTTLTTGRPVQVIALPVSAGATGYSVARKQFFFLLEVSLVK